MLTRALEWSLLLISAAATIVSLIHIVESSRAVRVASATIRFPIRLFVARIGRRAAILRLLFALTLLACALLLIGVPDQSMDYPQLINGFTLLLCAAAVTILLFGIADIRDRRKVTEHLQALGGPDGP